MTLRSRLACIVFPAVGAALLGLLSASQAQNDEETLRQRAIQSLRMELPDVVITPDSALWVNVGPNMRVSLEGVFAHCQGHDAEGCTHVLAARVEDIVQRYRKLKKRLGAEDVQLLVRSTANVTSLNIDVTPEPFLRGKPIVPGDLVVVCGFVFPDGVGVQPVSCAKLDYVGLPADVAPVTARANLAKSLRPLVGIARPVPAGRIGEIAGGSNEASRIVFPEQFADLAVAQGGVLVIAVPTYDTLIYVGEDSSLALARLSERARAIADITPVRRLSQRLLKWTPDGWKVIR